MTDARAATDQPVLATAGLTKRFGELVAVDDVTITIQPGEFRSLIGPNGAGKTTLFNLLSGALSPSAGRITFQGTDITAMTPAARVTRGLARSFQLTTVFEGLTVRENVRLAVQAAARPTLSVREQYLADTAALDDIADRTTAVLDRIDLAGRAATHASDLSYGDRRRLELGLVLATDPALVLLDEPTAGMSNDETSRTIELIESVLADRSLLLVEHDIDLVMRLSDRITVLNGGSEVTTGTPDEVAADDDVQAAYLGGYES